MRISLTLRFPGSEAFKRRFRVVRGMISWMSRIRPSRDVWMLQASTAESVPAIRLSIQALTGCRPLALNLDPQTLIKCSDRSTDPGKALMYRLGSRCRYSSFLIWA